MKSKIVFFGGKVYQIHNITTWRKSNNTNIIQLHIGENIYIFFFRKIIIIKLWNLYQITYQLQDYKNTGQIYFPVLAIERCEQTDE